MTSQFNENHFRQYILGTLTNKERERLEEEYFLDNELFENLLATEDELVENYLMNRLPESERTLFETRYLKTEQGKNQIQSNRSLLQAIEQVNVRIGKRRRERKFSLLQWMNNVFESLKEFNRPARVVFATLCVAMLIGLGFIVRYYLLLEQMEMLTNEQATLQQHAENLEQQVHEKEMQTEQLTSQLHSEQQKADSLMQTGAQVKSVATSLFAFVLSPGVLRGTDEQKTLQLPSESVPVVFTLDIEAEKTFTFYRAELRDHKQTILWSKSLLRQQIVDGVPVVKLQLSSGLFTDGNHVFTLAGNPNKNIFVTVGEYFFRVQKRKQ